MEDWEKNSNIITRHTSACFRIQSKEDFAKFANKNRYRNMNTKGESHCFGRFIRRLIKKKTGEIVSITCQHKEAKNKGYPKEFTNYETYNPKYRPKGRRTS